jgi:BirA family transcriptional regulator, biotin operon repressor / biotin---[acetyl-CoA-carboxylase] ligase
MRILVSIGSYVGAVSSDRATLEPWRVTRVAETGSTNADLLALARQGEPAGAVLVADHQRAGRGRLGRTWQAPPGASLLVSVLLRPGPSANPHGATQAVALAARTACDRLAGVRADLKWPNDLLVGGRKLAGILAEAVVSGAGVEAVVVGMGLNVRWGDGVPAELAERMVSLNHLTDRLVDRDALLEAFLAELTRRVAQWELDPGELVADYRDALTTVGQTVRVEQPAGVLVGMATGVTDDGHLVVEADGRRHEISAGDVVHLRPA